MIRSEPTRAQRWAWAPVSFVAALYVCWGLRHGPAHNLLGEQFLDAMGTQWFFWYVQQLFAEGGVAHSALLFFPFGKDVYLHTGGNLVDAVLALPLRAVFGPTLGYNLFVVLLFLLNGGAAARLARSFGLGSLAQATAALCLCLSPYLLIELEQGRPTQALVAPMLLGLAMLQEHKPLRAGLALALSGLTYWYYGALIGAAAALAFPVAMVVEQQRRKVVLTWGLAAVACAAVVAPAAWPMLSALSEGGVPGLLRFDGQGPLGGLWLQTLEGDRQGLFIQSLTGWAGPIVPEDTGPRFALGRRLMGPLQLVAALGGAFVLRKRGAVLWVWGALSMLVACGPVLSAGGPDNPLYGLLLEHFSMFRRWWWPMRATALAQICVAVWAGAAAQGLVQVTASVWRRLPERLLGALPIAGGAMLAPLWSLHLAPLDTWPAKVSSVVSECLRQAPDGAVIDLPLAWDQLHLYHQVWHQKPQMGGMLSQKPAFGSGQVDAWTAENDFADTLLAYGDRGFLRPAIEDERQRQALLDLGYRYVLVRHVPFRITTRRGTRSDYPRVERSIGAMLGPPVAVDREGAHPVSLWTLDGSDPCD